MLGDDLFEWTKVGHEIRCLLARHMIVAALSDEGASLLLSMDGIPCPLSRRRFWMVIREVWAAIAPAHGLRFTSETVASSAGKNASIASSERVISTGVPKIVVVLKNDKTPCSVRSRWEPGGRLPPGHPP